MGSGTANLASRRTGRSTKGGDVRTDERTYKQHLSGGDSDKKQPMHEAGVAYLTQNEKLRKLVGMMWQDGVYQSKYSVSRPVVAHEGTKYARIWGYADLLIEVGCEYPDQIGTGSTPFRYGYPSGRIVVEVKAQPAPMSNIIQQLSSYRHVLSGGYSDDRFVLATLYRISVKEKEMLTNEGMYHVYLDPDYVKAWNAVTEMTADQAF